MIQVVLTISGGVLQSVVANSPDVQYVLIDHDNLKAGDGLMTCHIFNEPDQIIEDLSGFIENETKEYGTLEDSMPAELP